MALIYSFRAFFKKWFGICISMYRYILGNPKNYFSFENRKKKVPILRDLVSWVIHEHEFNMNYYMFGLNQEGTKNSDFLGRKNFKKIKKRAEELLQLNVKFQLSKDIITKDKFYCSSILSSNGYPVIKDLLLIVGERTFSLDKSTKYSIGTLPDGQYIIKNLHKESGQGIYNLEIRNRELSINDSLYNELPKSMLENRQIYVIQKRYKSHKDIARINSSALNTLRIFTIQGAKNISYLGGYHAFATDEAPIDSWKMGSIYIGIDRIKGNLMPFGFTSLIDKRVGILNKHPNSNIVFKDYQIPFLNESIELCINAHSLFYFNFIIGWDIAITDTGPIIVEANELPGISVLQATNGGIKKRILSEYRDINNSIK